MKYLKYYEKFIINESNKMSSLLDIADNIDTNIISKIESLIKPGSSILEISCGNGADSIKLKDDGYNVTCTDLDINYVNNASKYVNAIQHNTSEAFPFDNNTFDLIYSRLGLHYFNQDELVKIFKELSRLTSNYLIFTVKLTDNIQTGKVILSDDVWVDLTNKYFDIISSEIKEGMLYGLQSKWLEVVATKKNNSINESTQELDDIFQTLNDIADLVDETGYSVGKYNIQHFEFDIQDTDRASLNAELNRIKQKISQPNTIMYEMNHDSLFLAILPIKLKEESANYPNFSDLKQVDTVKSHYRFEFGNSILVWYLPDSPYHDLLNNATEDYEVESTLDEDLWRTNSPLMITFCMWDNHTRVPKY